MLMTRFQYLFGLAFTGAMALAGGFVATLVMQPGAPVHAQEGDALAVVKTSELQLVDSKGVLRARLHVGKKGETLLAFSDEDGTKRAELMAAKGRAAFGLVDVDEEPRFAVGYDGKLTIARVASVGSEAGYTLACNEGLVSETINDEEGNIRVLASYTKDSGTLFALQEGAGKKQVALMGAPDGATLELHSGRHVVAASASKEGPALMALQTSGKLRYRIGVTPAGAPEMILNDSKGVWGVLAAITSDDRPVIGIGRDGVPRVRGVMDSNGTPILETLDKKGETEWRAGGRSQPSEAKAPDQPDTPKSE
jgi:hypothetical protein